MTTTRADAQVTRQTTSILAVTPWDHVWRHYVSAPATPWRRA